MDLISLCPICAPTWDDNFIDQIYGVFNYKFKFTTSLYWQHLFYAWMHVCRVYGCIYAWCSFIEVTCKPNV